MKKLRKALREMFAIGVVFGIGIYIVERNANYDILGSLLIGFVFSFPIWAIYRLFRFMFFPPRNEPSY